MQILSHSRALISTLFLVLVSPAYGDGPVGEHVNDLRGHLDEYAGETKWLIAQVRNVVDSYAEFGLKAVEPEEVLEHWETVKLHSAIESNYVPLYASIWQGLFSVKTGIENEKPIEAVRNELVDLEHALWQSLGAVKLAAEYQDQGLLKEVQTRQAITPSAILIEIKQSLDRVLAKYAERLQGEALQVTQKTYQERFEAVEGRLIEQDAELTEELEIYFNVHLPQAIQRAEGTDEVRAIIDAMKGKIDKARELIKDAEKT